METKIEQEIILAIKRKNMKEQLIEQERGLRIRRKIWLYCSSALLAACLIFGVIVRASSVENCISLSKELYSNVVFRGADSIITTASELLKEEKFVELEIIISEQIPLLQEEYEKHLGGSEKELYDKEIIKVKIEELQWIEAISLMKQGKVYKAKKRLKVISSEGGAHAEDALLILKKI